MRKRDACAMVLQDDPQFTLFWDAYPKRVAKKEARKAWAQLKPTPAMVEQMIDTLSWQCLQPDWLRDGGQFIPFPASWLRSERWTDERVSVPNMSARTMRMLGSV